MNLTYPLFIQAKDDKSIVKFDSWNKLENWYEQIDIEEGLYEGWDINGYPIKLIWDNQSGSKIEILEEHPHIDQLINAIKDYAQDYRPKVTFNNSVGSDVAEFFQAAQEHINQDRLFYRISKKFQSFLRKKAE